MCASNGFYKFVAVSTTVSTTVSTVPTTVSTCHFHTFTCNARLDCHIPLIESFTLSPLLCFALLLCVLQHAIHSPRNLASLLGKTVCVIFQPPSPFLRKVDLPRTVFEFLLPRSFRTSTLHSWGRGGCMTCNR